MGTMSGVRLFILLCQASLCLPLMAQDRHSVILEKFIEKRNGYTSMAYDIELKLKGFSDEDTQVYVAKVELVRMLDDSLYGGNFSIQVEDSLWYGYNGNIVMRAVLEDSTIAVADIASSPGAFVKSTWADNFLDYGFLKRGEGPKLFLRNPEIKSTFIDTMFGDWPCLGIFFDLPDEDIITNQVIFMAIDTLEYVVRNRMYSAFFQDNEQYTNWLFNNVSYGHDTDIEQIDIAIESNAASPAQMETNTRYEPKQGTYNYSRLTGKLYNQEEEFRLADIVANYIILDFWYSSCYPCIKGIPSVNRVYREYKDNGVKVFGINMVDDEIKGKARLEKFFKNNLMEYPPVMVDPGLANEIGIRIYPTILVLDKDYQIVFKEEGFSELLYEKVAAFLNTK